MGNHNYGHIHEMATYLLRQPGVHLLLGLFMEVSVCRRWRYLNLSVPATKFRKG